MEGAGGGLPGEYAGQHPGPGGIPRWYLALHGDGEIAGGCGIIENDFHARKDLRPNLCALYVEPQWRGRGIARLLLDTGRADAGAMGLRRLYLITDHTDFYEACGWRFLTMADCDSGEVSRVYEAETFPPPAAEREGGRI